MTDADAFVRRARTRLLTGRLVGLLARLPASAELDAVMAAGRPQTSRLTR